MCITFQIAAKPGASITTAKPEHGRQQAVDDKAGRGTRRHGPYAEVPARPYDQRDRQ